MTVPKSEHGWKFWADRGGTFTDLVALTPAGKVLIRKLLSESPGTYSDPVVYGIEKIMEENTGTFPESGIDCIRAGTTLATNALLERKGEPCILITTKGFKDVFRIGWQERPDLFALNIDLPPMLYEQVLEVPGRISADGSVVLPLDLEGLQERLLSTTRKGIRSCAIVLMNSYKNSDHEQKVAELARRSGFEWIAVSSELTPLIRFINRGDTALADASLNPGISRYKTTLSHHFPGVPLLFMQSHGGLVAASEFHGKDGVLSGPAGGLAGAVKVADQAGYSKIISFDMGGTSTDVALSDGRFEYTWERVLAGVRLQQPMLNIHTVAAGGGSVLRYSGSRFQAGPESAGAWPGPACYGRGGPLTITDCNLYLGRVREEFFPKTFGSEGKSGLERLPVHQKLVELQNEVFLREGLTYRPEELCESFLNVATENIAQAIRKVSVHKGKDPGDYVLCCYGGAGGQVVCSVAESLGISRVFIHKYSGVLSALGMGLAPVSRIWEKNISLLLDERGLSEATSAITGLQKKATIWAGKNSSGKERLNICSRLILSFRNSDARLSLGLSGLHSLKKNFHEKHLEMFGYEKSDSAIYICSVSLEAALHHDAGSDLVKSRYSMPDVHKEKAGLWLEGKHESVPLIRPEQLSEGMDHKGPALLVQPHGCILVRPGWEFRVDEWEGIHLTKENTTKSDIGRSNKDLNPLQLELFHSAFMSVAEQMGEVLARSACSVNIRERLDYSCAVFDPNGQLISNAPHMPVHLGSMSECVRYLLQESKKEIEEGSAWLMNSPFHGGTHLPDLTVVSPVFAGCGKLLLGFVASRGHHADIGGISPGSMPSMSKECTDEGVLIPLLRILDKGKFREQDLRSVLESGRWPARSPEQNISDIKAKIAANVRGIRELRKLDTLSGPGVLRAYMNHVLENGEKVLRSRLKELKGGHCIRYTDQGIRLEVRITTDQNNGSAVFDFSGSSGQGEHNFNAPFAVCKASVLYVLRCLIRDGVPLNDGCLRPVTLIVPEGSVLNPLSPAAVVAGNVETSSQLVDLIFGAFAIKAGSQGTMNNFSFGNDNCQYYETICGGEGATLSREGCSAVHTHMTNSRLTDPEILEQRFPVRLESFTLRDNSGGTGCFRGGDGVIRSIRFLAKVEVNILSGCRKVPPAGLKGGGDGVSGLNIYIPSGQESRVVLPGVVSLTASSGDRIIIETPGGGGAGAV